jgi:molybdopterin-binding protein
LQFDYKQVFTTNVSLDVYVNGILLTTVTSASQEGVVIHTPVIPVNVAGDFILDFKQTSTSSGQVAVDNIAWTGNNTILPEPTNYPTNFAAVGGNFKVTVNWADATGAQAPSGYLILGSATDNFTAPVDGTPVPDNPNLANGPAAKNILAGVQTYQFTGLFSNTPYYFRIYPYTNSGSLINYKTDGTAPSVNATTPNTFVIIQQNFNAFSLSPWTAVSVTGDQGWTIDSIHGTSSSACAKMSGYLVTNLQNEDWLISPAMNFNKYTNEVLNFNSAYNYAGDPLVPMISNNYSGSGAPGSATWTPLTATLSPGGWVYTSSGDVDVSSVNGTSVYIAFKYTSSTTAASTWELDDVLVMGIPIVGIDEHSAIDFNVSPNPSKGMVKLTFSGNEQKDVKIVNILGNVVASRITTQSTETFDLTSLSNGIYFVQVKSENSSKMTTKKLVIQ